MFWHSRCCLTANGVGMKLQNCTACPVRNEKELARLTPKPVLAVVFNHFSY